MFNATQENSPIQTDARTVRPDGGHAVWCSPGAHARANRECDGGHPGCIGREIYLKVGKREIGGNWSQDPDGESHFAAEWDMWFPNLDIGAMLSLYRLFLCLSWHDVSRLTTLLGEAIDDYEGGDAWRDSFDL